MQMATISSKRQITLPKELLSQVGIRPGGKVLIEKDKRAIKLKPLKKSIVEQTYASLNKYVHPSKLGISVEEIAEQTFKKAAQEIATKR